MASTQQSTRDTFATKRALVYFFIAYVLVTVLATSTSVIYGIVNNSPPQEKQLGTSPLQVPEFVATVPYHVLIMLIVFPVFAYLYFRKRPQSSSDQELRETFRLSVLWLVGAVAVDLVAFVLPGFFALTRYSYSFTPHEFYVIYQPWISLIYISIFLSPWIRLAFSKLIAKK